MNAPQQPAVERLLQRAEQLNLFPAAATRIRTVADDPDSTLDQLHAAVSADPALAAHVMKIANSPFYGLRKTVGSLRQALLIMGFSATRDLALALAILSLEKRRSNKDGALWQHSIRTGVAAKELAVLSRVREPASCFVAGLLHDFGKLILSATEPTRWKTLARKGYRSAEERLAEERAVFGVDHAELAALCLERWNLPAAICASVANHHVQINDLDGSRIDVGCVAVVVLGNTLSYIPADAGEHLARIVASPAAQLLCVGHDQLYDLRERLDPLCAGLLG